MQEITRDARNTLSILYELYCQRLKDGIPKSAAAFFKIDVLDAVAYPLQDDLPELKRAGLVSVDILGNVRLEAAGVLYMENKPVETVKEWLSLVSQFIP